MNSFEILAKDDGARAGKLITPHGVIQTPAFVAVGTLATVKALSGDDLLRAGCQVMISNTYHLHLQPGEDFIERMGGLHCFMGWDRSLMTDSGGFQIFSLGAGKEHRVGKIASVFPEETISRRKEALQKGKSLVKVDEDGVEFISWIDGSLHRFTPEQVVEIEKKIGADIIFVLDECTSPLHDYRYTRSAMERTHRWAQRAWSAFQETADGTQALWGIVQGGAFQDLRKESGAVMAALPFHGYGIGGSLGKSKEDMYGVLEWTVPVLPQDKPRHLLGIGTIEDIFEVVRRGIDSFDCIAPTLLAQTGTFFHRTAEGFTIHILNAKFKDDPRPVEEGCSCIACRRYSRAFLRHLFMVKESTGIRLAALHNLTFVESLMDEIRSAIQAKRFEALRKAWLFHSCGH